MLKTNKGILELTHRTAGLRLLQAVYVLALYNSP